MNLREEFFFFSINWPSTANSANHFNENLFNLYRARAKSDRRLEFESATERNDNNNMVIFSTIEYN